jgi:hypothetical protein
MPVATGRPYMLPAVSLNHFNDITTMHIHIIHTIGKNTIHKYTNTEIAKLAA